MKEEITYDDTYVQCTIWGIDPGSDRDIVSNAYVMSYKFYNQLHVIII